MLGLFVLVLLGFEGLLGLLALLNKEEVLLLQGSKYLHQLVWRLEEELVVVVGVLDHLPQVARDLHVVVLLLVTARLLISVGLGAVVLLNESLDLLFALEELVLQLLGR